MSYLLILLPKLTGFMILIALGFTVSKLGIIKEEGLPTLSGFLIKVVLPILTISIMDQRGTTFMDLFSYRKMVLCQIGAYLILAAVGILVSRAMKLSFPIRNLHQGCMVGGNYAFFCIPLIMALFTADDGQQYIPICSAVDTIVVWTLAVSLFTHGSLKEGDSRIKDLLSKLLHPIMIAILGMLLINSLHVQIPTFILDVCDGIGDISYSLGLIYVGANICYMKKGSKELIRPVGMIVLMKLLIVPFVVYLIASRFMPQTESIILMIITGAPTMTTSTMIAQQYGMDGDYCATAVFITTICCLFTIPILFVLISFI